MERGGRPVRRQRRDENQHREVRRVNHRSAHPNEGGGRSVHVPVHRVVAFGGGYHARVGCGLYGAVRAHGQAVYAHRAVPLRGRHNGARTAYGTGEHRRQLQRGKPEYRGLCTQPKRGNRHHAREGYGDTRYLRIHQGRDLQGAAPSGTGGRDLRPDQGRAGTARPAGRADGGGAQNL